MEDIKPISPEEALNEKKIHPGIIKIVNNFLAERYSSGKSVTITKNEIVKKFKTENPDFDITRLANEHHLDFEDAYRTQGWNVVYDQPGYCESYESTYSFSKKK